MNFVNYSDAFFGAVHLLWQNNIFFDILRFPEELEHYSRIYCPMPWMIDIAMAEKIKAFVRNGGTFISEGGFGRYTDQGWLSKEVPGWDLSHELGYKETEFNVAEKIEIYTPQGTVYGLQERNSISNLSDQNSVIGTFEDGTPAILESQYGKGRFIYIGSSISSYFTKYDDIPTAQKCITLLGFESPITISPVGQIIARMLIGTDCTLLFLFNHSRKISQADLSLNCQYDDYQTILGSGITETEPRKFKVTMNPTDVLIVKLNGQKKPSR